MRLIIQCALERSVPFPINQQQHLAALVYRFLNTSDPEYARFLHNDGYAIDAGARRYKLFTFSGLRAPRHCRRMNGDTLWLGPGNVHWQISSPREDFLRNFATGLLATGALEVGSQRLPIAEARTVSTPDFSAGTARFTCLSPIVAGVPDAEGTRYLRPCEGEAFSQAVRKNLLHKYQALHGAPPPDDRFAMTFDARYLADPRPREGTKLVRFKEISIVGAQAPFTATGAPDLLELMWDCGAGEKNAAGFGMVDLTNSPDRQEQSE